MQAAKACRAAHTHQVAEFKRLPDAPQEKGGMANN